MPGSPAKPSIAFHIDVLRAYEAARNISFVSYEGYAEYLSEVHRSRVSVNAFFNWIGVLIILIST